MRVMQLSYGQPRGVQPPKIGHPSLAEAGVTRERVRQICNRALEKLRAAADRRPEPNRRRL